MVIPGQLIPFICGCLLCLGTLASVFIAIGSGYVKHEDEDSREPKIRKFCEAVDRWQSGGSGYHALPQYRFYLMGPNWVTVPCDLVEHGYEVGFEHDVGSFTDYQCPGYGLRKLRCPRLDLVLGEPTVNTEYNVTLRGESALRSSRHEPPVLVGTVATQIAAQEGRLLPVEHTDDCHDDCAVDKARSLCTNELEGVAYENGEYVRCETLRLIDQPCFVLTCDEDCHLEDASRWKIRPDSRCSGAAGYAAPGWTTHRWDDELTKSEALRSLISPQYWFFRASDDPYIVAAEITGGSFDFGASSNSLYALGVFLIILGSLTGCCYCCFCACVCFFANEE